VPRPRKRATRRHPTPPGRPRRKRAASAAPNPRGVTSHDVASLAGVSRSAVSRSFTPEASVSEKTRRKVMAAAQKLGYQPNVIARSLITRQSRLIGLVMGEWENPFYTTMLRDFTEKLGGRDYQLMLLASRTPADVEAAMRMLMRYRVDGIVFVSASPTPESAADYVRTGGRLVLVGYSPHPMSLNSGRVMFREIEVTGSLGCRPVDYPRVIELARQGKIKVAELVTHRFPLDRINDGLDALRAGLPIRAIVVPGD
jgi:hypothetical protein